MTEDPLRFLTGLNHEQLKAARSRIDFLLQGHNSGPTQGEDWVVLGIGEVLRSRGQIGADVPIAMMVNEAKIRASVSAVQRLLLDRVGRPLNATEKTALGICVAEALADLIRSFNMPVAVRTMVNNINKIPEALEQSFPGYLESGMIGMLIKTRRR